MPLSGHLSDLSLSELIEFFCNQRKTGQLKVLYPQGHGDFYLQTGSVVDARIGVLRGIEAVYYALTLPNAKFEFSGSDESMERTINQPWTQVVLEGLRRLDEGVVPANAFPAGYSAESVEPKPVEDVAPPKPIENLPERAQNVEPKPIAKHAPVAAIEETRMPPFLSTESEQSAGRGKIWIAGAVAAAVIASVAAIGFPAGWYGRKAGTSVANQPAITETNTTASSPHNAEVPGSDTSAPSGSADETDRSIDPAIAAKRQHERAKAREEKAAMNQPAASLSSRPATSVSADSAKSGPKKVTVTVTYDESGRVTQASGGDASAVRIARQKRFPAGKAGSATITIPIN